MTPAFRFALEFTLAQEGGYVHDPNDPGGETKFGISKRRFSDVDIPNLTRQDAAAIYKREYWDAIKGDKLPRLTALVMFDWSVHAGVQVAVHGLQKQLGGLKVDGKVGLRTLAQAHHVAPNTPKDMDLAYAVHYRRIKQLVRLVQKDPKRARYLLGWMRRTHDMVALIIGGVS